MCRATAPSLLRSRCCYALAACRPRYAIVSIVFRATVRRNAIAPDRSPRNHVRLSPRTRQASLRRATTPSFSSRNYHVPPSVFRACANLSDHRRRGSTCRPLPIPYADNARIPRSGHARQRNYARKREARTLDWSLRGRDWPIQHGHLRGWNMIGQKRAEAGAGQKWTAPICPDAVARCFLMAPPDWPFTHARTRRTIRVAGNDAEYQQAKASAGKKGCHPHARPLRPGRPWRTPNPRGWDPT